MIVDILGRNKQSDMNTKVIVVQLEVLEKDNVVIAHEFCPSTSMVTTIKPLIKS
jgi:hypothetical protein